MSETRVIKHAAAPGFVTGVATGITIHGPSPDGNVHLTFFHDTAYPTQGEVVSRKSGENDVNLQVKQGATISEGFEIVRHNIATISVRQDQIDAMGKAFTLIAEHRAKAEAAKKGEPQNDAGSQPHVTA